MRFVTVMRGTICFRVFHSREMDTNTQRRLKNLQHYSSNQSNIV